MTNNKVLGLLSMENMGSLIAMAFVFGIGYSALASEVGATTNKVSSMESEQKQLVRDVQTIQTDVAVIKNDQKHISEQLRIVLRLLESERHLQ